MHWLLCSVSRFKRTRKCTNRANPFNLRDYIAHLDGFTVIKGGWVNRHWMQMGYQLADSVTGGAYSFAGTCIILGCIDGIGKFFPVLKLRATEEEEILGIDDVEIGEFAVSSNSSPYIFQANLVIVRLC